MNKSVNIFKTAFLSGMLILTSAIPAIARQPAGHYLTATIPASWPTDSLLAPVLPTEDRWWIELGDSCLTALIDEAVAKNHDLLAAAQRIKAARALYNNQLAAYSPDIGINAGWVNDRTSGNQANTPADPSLLRYLEANLTVSWQIDLFGSILLKARSLKEQYNATRAEYNGAMITLCAQIATHYITLRTYQAQMKVAQSNILSQQAILRMTEIRFNTGLASALDVAQAKTVYYNTRSSIPQLDAAIDSEINAIAVLTGNYPQTLHDKLHNSNKPIDYLRIVEVGIPYDLLRRRPDIRQAEYDIAAKAATVGATITDFLPTLTLNGNIGFASHDTSRFLDKNSLTYNITPAISWTLFSGTGRIQAKNEAKAQMQVAIETYNSTVLTAVQEVENAMSAYKNGIRQIVFLRELVTQGQLTLDLSLDLYKGGLTDFQTVLDAQRQLLSYQNSLESTYGKTLLSLINLYQALGGGWDIQEKK